MADAMEKARLDEFDKDEWRDVCRLIRPDITGEQFEADWLEFLAMKQRKETN